MGDGWGWEESMRERVRKRETMRSKCHRNVFDIREEHTPTSIAETTENRKMIYDEQ